MSKDTLVLIELLFIVGLIAWFGIVQIRSVRKPPAERKDDSDGSGEGKT